ncbi:hypothetical protein [Sporolactobacillus nakayamae]|uniref:SIR2-like domain-containing protein n=1 Tax=Sporolactobacillus nakayamae TaxID=269670 RepID=A0A1I2UF59_9BACL|nr:hypothetical protein [Sporolactobacillus nakayamae]SFG73516.1 hypothetical protein SAMN02982927_02606 [Sporolactobacillus nakayamae]
MIHYENYNPYWPETVIFWGAGTTEPLHMKTTNELGKMFQTLTEADKNLGEAIDQVIPEADEQVRSELKALLELIDSEFHGHEDEAIRVLDIPKDRAQHLQMLYDWNAVKLVIERCPRNRNHRFSLDDLYNLLDLHIQAHKGIEVEQRFITLDRLIAARRTLTMLTQLIHAIGYVELLHDSDTKALYHHYYEFATILAGRMREEGVQKAAKQISFDDRNFYLFSYAMISMNWDPILLWLIFNAHKEMNSAADCPKIGDPPQPMKLFNDLVHFIAVRKVDGRSPSAWFPMNETAVQQMNDSEYQTGRRIRIGKFYFPHGCHGFRQCPKCGKLTFYLGNEWCVDSPCLFPPQIIPSLSPRSPRSLEEKKAIDAGIFDAVQCTYCGTITESHHTAIAMQTHFKAIQPSFIQEIQNDMKVAIEHAQHIIFAGYSLPDDDFIDRIMLSARRKMDVEQVKCSVINFDQHAKEEWMYGEELNDFCRKYDRSSLASTCNRVAGIFGEANIRGYGAGFPNVFMKNGKADKDKVEEMMRMW